MGEAISMEESSIVHPYFNRLAERSIVFLIQLKFKQSCERVVEHCSYVCGIIIDKEDSLVAPGAKLSQDYIDQIK